MMRRPTHRFTMIEVLVVLGVISILATGLMPRLNASRKKAQYVRWKAFNNSLNSDPSLVLNLDFEFPDTTIDSPSGRVPAVLNRAEGCDIENFVGQDYHGVMRNSPEWRRGRWPNKWALQFNGSNTYVDVQKRNAVNFDPSDDDFTVTAWVNFDRLGYGDTIFSKCAWLASAQYDVYHLTGGRLEADVGGGSPWGIFPNTGLAPNEWHQVVLRNTDGRFQLYFDGEQMSNTGGDVSGSGTSNANFRIGCAGNSGGGTSYHFKGRIDEVLMFRRALTPAEIKGHYEMGAP